MNPYIPTILEYVPRMLSLIDRDEDSPTYGCFDRNFWHYKIRDFPSAILQQGCLLLAQLYTHKFQDNVYYGNDLIKQWSIAAMHHWASIQHKDGSFDEYWPNEHGYPPTVFASYSVSEAYRILELDDRKILDALALSARTLIARKETGAVNQEIASIAALYSIHLTTTEDTQNESLVLAINNKLSAVLKKQNDEGWFPEYGGADIGYLSVSLHFLVEYYRMSQDNTVLGSIKKMVEFIQYFIHPDGTCGGDYGSRNTSYFLRGGLEVISKHFPLSGAIADKLLESRNSIDQRYMEHYVAPAFMTALIHHRVRRSKMKLPVDKKGKKYFKDAGLIVVNTEKYYTICNLNKGGVLTVFKDHKRIVNDCGYRIWTPSLGVTNWVEPSAKKNFAGRRCGVTVNFHRSRFLKPTPIKHAGLRILSKLMGRKLIPIMKKVFITSSKKLDVRFRRDIEFKEDTIEITDFISSKSTIQTIKSNHGFSLRYVPSSKYFAQSELFECSPKFEEHGVKKMKIDKKIDIQTETVSINSSF